MFMVTFNCVVRCMKHILKVFFFLPSHFLHLNTESLRPLAVYNMSNFVLLHHQSQERVKSVFGDGCETHHAGIYPTGNLGKIYSLANSQRITESQHAWVWRHLWTSFSQSPSQSRIFQKKSFLWHVNGISSVSVCVAFLTLSWGAMRIGWSVIYAPSICHLFIRCPLSLLFFRPNSPSSVSPSHMTDAPVL